VDCHNNWTICPIQEGQCTILIFDKWKFWGSALWDIGTHVRCNITWVWVDMCPTCPYQALVQDGIEKHLFFLFTSFSPSGRKNGEIWTSVIHSIRCYSQRNEFLSANRSQRRFLKNIIFSLMIVSNWFFLLMIVSNWLERPIRTG